MQQQITPEKLMRAGQPWGSMDELSIEPLWPGLIMERCAI
jgi:hypothetical protein